jgi:hypothetical protein
LLITRHAGSDEILNQHRQAMETLTGAIMPPLRFLSPGVFLETDALSQHSCAA